MAAPGAHRRRNRSLGHIPLSSGEIELYSRQDEAARRRRRLLAVREQERRLAQQVTQRYHDNLLQLQRGKGNRVHKQLNLEHHKLLTELHVRYRNSLQNMGTAQRNARLKMLELLEQAQEEKDKWKYNHQVTGKQRTLEAEEAREQEEQLRTARRRQVQQNMERLRLLSDQQRQQASARARQEQEVAMQRAKDREEIETLRRMQSPEEVFITPRPHEKDALSYQFTRTHCHAPTPTMEKPVVTVIRHNRKHPTAMRGEEEAKKYSEEMDLKRERDRLTVEEQKQTAAERGQNALENVTSKQQGRQALEWLALVNKMERHTRGQELGGRDDYPLDAGEVDGETDDPDRMAERAFARMLALDEESVELSAFSIETDDDLSVGLADIDHEKSDGDNVTDADADYKVKLKTARRSGSVGSLDGIESRRPGTHAKDGRGEATMEEPVKTATFKNLQREEFEKQKKTNDGREKSVPQEGVGVPLKPGAGKYEDKLDKYGVDDGGHRGNMTDAQHLRWDPHASGANTATRDDRGRRRYVEERPEGTDSEEDELDDASDQIKGRDDSIQRLENRLQEVLDFRLSKPQDRSFPVHQVENERESRSSGSDLGQRGSQLEEVAVKGSQGSWESRPSYEFSDTSDGPVGASDRSVLAASSESGQSSLSRTSRVAVPSGHRSPSSDLDERSVARADDFLQDGRLYDTRRGSDLAASMEPEQMQDSRRFSQGYSSPIYLGEEPTAGLRDDRVGVPPEYDVQSDIAGDNRLGSSAASSESKYLSGHYGDEHEYDEAGREERDSRLEGSRGQDAVAPQSKADSPILDRNETDEKVFHGSRERDVERLSMQSAQQKDLNDLESRHSSDTRHVQAFVDERGGHLSFSPVTSGDEEVHDDTSAFESKNSRMVQVDEDERSVSDSSFAPGQKSLSYLDEVVNARARSLEQRFIDQHMMSFSSPEGHSEDGKKAATGVHRPSIDSNDTHPPVNVSPYDPYRQQIDHRARRSSTSAVSVAQYSLPPSDTQSSFDDSFDQLRPGYGDDSFVNELVPMFPKRAVPPRSLEEENEAVEDYDVQLVAPNMSRMLTSDRRASLGRSRQHQPQPGSTDRSRREVAATTPRRAEENDGSTKRSFSSSSRRSSSGSSYSAMEAKSIDTSVEQSSARQQPTMATRPHTRQVHGDNQGYTIEHHDSDDRSDISSDSGVSSLGFAVQLNLVAGTTRRRKDGGDQQENSKRGDNPQRKRTQENARDDELDNQSVASERSFASNSSMSMDAHFNYLANMTSAVGKSLPLHLRIPAMIYGKKDMTKPPAPMDWSASSVSSIASASEADPDEASERDSLPARRIPHSNSSSSESLLEEQAHQKMDRSDESSDRESTSDAGEKRATRLTFDNMKEKVSQLPPPPLGSLNMSRPPPPMQLSNRHLDESQSSSEQHSDDFQSSERRPLPPPPVGSINMSQPPPMQNFRHDSDDSLDSEDVRSSEKRSALRHSKRHSFGAEEERKQGDASSESSDASFSSSLASSRRQIVKKPERIVIPVKKSRGDNNDSDGDQAGKDMSLAAAFQRRHPRFGQRVESHRDKLKRQRDKQQQEQEQQTAAKRDTVPQCHSTTDDLLPEKQELLNRLASGSRAKISSREMKERSRRLYHQLPEVVERKRQEEVMRRRRERLNELREQEKERRLQQKQRRHQRR
ncbi:hypothetical protein PI124_g10587 [Phytophthora idaei]|nr:hypothetical protein PI125_g8839 [Phytophthora idaei]KAG3157584.1 hypothetical protein PI126_g8253 [Phytophthora idaei]KAG3244646.1 hypothetical protein PI124_g10587 [Phytophthora idaei]